MQLTYKIKPNEVGNTLIHLLTAKYTYYSLEEWKNQILEQKILLNAEVTKENVFLNLNDEIRFFVEDFVEPEVNSDYSIIYEDEYLFAVNKSGNLPVHPAGRYRKGNLTTLLTSSGRKDIFIVNRLDRETSGIVLFGKSTEAASKLGKLFESGKIKKTYICYVEGLFPKSLSARGYLGKDKDSLIRKKKKFSHEKLEDSLWEVHTDFRIIESNHNLSKIYAYPHTGKIHQIRATLYSLGYPVVGDKMYGYDENLFLEFIQTGIAKNKYKIERQALHAYELEFIHPFLNQNLNIKAEEPEDMKEIF